MRQSLRGIAYRLFEPVDGVSLAVFRLLFEAIMLGGGLALLLATAGSSPSRRRFRS